MSSSQLSTPSLNTRLCMSNELSVSKLDVTLCVSWNGLYLPTLYTFRSIPLSPANSCVI